MALQNDEVKKQPKKEIHRNTPYDDVFRTMLVDVPELVLPLLNEIFGEKYTGNEKIIFTQNEHFLNTKSEDWDKVETDASFVVEGETSKRYVFECQSTVDKNMIVRIFEYVLRVSKEHGEVIDDVLRIEIPNPAILYLRSNKNTPDKMMMQVVWEDKMMEVDVMILKLADYDMKKMFERKCYFLLPFISFLHEKEFKLYNKDEEKLAGFLEEQQEVLYLLRDYAEDGILSERTAGIIKDMLNKVNMSILNKYGNVKKGVEEIMGGKVLEYPTKTLYRKAKAEGLAQGRAEGEAIGVARGREQGRIEEQLKFATFMMQENYSLQRIIERTGLNKQMLMNLAEENNIQYNFAI